MKNLEIPGLSFSLPMALFSNNECIVDTYGNISNGHWALFVGAPHFDAVKAALEKRYEVARKKKRSDTELRWRNSWRYVFANDLEGFSFDVDFRVAFNKFYHSGRFGLADDRVLLDGTGFSAKLSASAAVEEVDDGIYEIVETGMPGLYEEVINPQYYLIFRKLGYHFLIGPGAWRPVIDGAGEPVYKDEKPVMTHDQQIILLTTHIEADLYGVEGVLMPQREDATDA